MEEINTLDISVIPNFVKFGQKHYWVDYDEEANTLYISFRKPQCADDSIMKNNIIYHYDGKELVGLTVLHAKNI